jgi:TonB family protein
MAVCLECGFDGKPDAGSCPKCGAADAPLPAGAVPASQLLQSGLAAGHVLARKYEIRRKLGGGGFGWVYLAHDLGLDKEVAVKVLHLADPAAMNAGEAKKRFLREARAMARLDQHPNIVRVMNVDEDGGVPYFVMEYLPEGTLLDLVKRGPVPPARAASIAADIAAALAAVHASGTIHRDLKPANIFIKGDRAMLGDFGIAYVAEESALTVGSGMPGTPMYMSPEALLGKEVDGRSDIFSLGCVLYESLTGEVLFKGDSVGQVVGKIIDPEEVDLTGLRGAIPAPLLAALKRALAKKFANRYPNPRFMERDLRAVAGSPESAGSVATMIAARAPADPGRVSVPTKVAAGIPRAAESVILPPAPAKRGGDGRTLVIASLALALALGALWFVVHADRNRGAAAASDQAAHHPPAPAPGERAVPPARAGTAVPSPPPEESTKPVDIGIHVEGPVQVGDATPDLPAPAGSHAQPRPGASASAGSAVITSEWRPTRLEEALENGIRPPRARGGGELRPDFMTDGMSPPELVTRIEPDYPEAARSAGEEGKVILEIVIDRTGDVGGVKVQKGNPLLAAAATEAVRLWRFLPAKQNGRPVKVFATITLDFKLGPPS